MTQPKLEAAADTIERATKAVAGHITHALGLYRGFPTKRKLVVYRAKRRKRT